MPYKVVGNCVHKLNADGSVGEVVPGGCHDTPAQAAAHARALYANVEDVKTKEVRPPNLHRANSPMACVHCAYYMGIETGTCKAYNQYPVDANDTCDAWEDKLSGVSTKDVSAVASPTGLHGPNSLLGVEGMGSDRKKRTEVKMADSEGHGGFLVTEPDGTTHLPTRKNGKLDHGLMGAAWAALHGGYRGKPYGGPNKSGAISKLTALYKSEGIPTPSEEKSKTKELDPRSAVNIFKQENGRYRWVLSSTSGFRDGDGEILATKALAEDTDRMNRDGNYGPLRWWHVGSKENANPQTRDPGIGLDIGDCDYAAMHGHTRIESGTFRNDALAAELATRTKSLGGSLGFFYPQTQPDSDGVISRVYTFERSLLPREVTSNLMALKQLFFGKEEPVESKQIAKLKELVGAANAPFVDEFLASITQKEGTLKDAGVKVKAKAEEPDAHTHEHSHGDATHSHEHAHGDMHAMDEAGMKAMHKHEHSAAEEKALMEAEEEQETPEEEKKESPAYQKKEAELGVEKHATKTKEAEMTALADAIGLKMSALIDTKFAELNATRTKEASETATALKSLSDRIATLEGETPESKRGMKASSSAATVVDHPLMRAALEQLAQSQGLTEALGLKATPQDDFTRLAQRMTSHLPNAGTNGQ